MRNDPTLAWIQAVKSLSRLITEPGAHEEKVKAVIEAGEEICKVLTYDETPAPAPAPAVPAAPTPSAPEPPAPPAQ